MADDGGISDNASVGEVRAESAGNPGGWSSLGKALGGGMGGPGTIAGETAYQNGMRVGAQTADALAQAKDRVQKSEAAHQAGAALRSPELQAQLKISPELGNYYATQAELGKEPDAVTQMLLKNQEFQRRATIADPTQSLESRHAAAYAQDPASMAPKAEGSLGSVFDPGANKGSGETSVGPLQKQVAQSEIGQHNASASAMSGLATQRDNQPFGPNGAGQTGAALFGKPPANMRYVMKPDGNGDPTDTHNYVLDSTGRPSVEPIPGALTEPSTADRFHGVMIMGMGNLANEVHNISRLGFTTTLGATNISGSKPGGILEAIRQNAGNKMSDSDQQLYDTSTKQMGRFLGVNENGGRFVSEAVAQDITHNLANIPAHSEAAMYGHIAAVKQIAQASDDTIQASHASPAYKAISARRRAEIEADVPFSMDDAIDLSKGTVNPAIEKYIRGRMGGSSKSSGPPPGMTLVN